MMSENELETNLDFIVKAARGVRQNSNIYLSPSKRPPTSPNNSNKLYVYLSIVVKTLLLSTMKPLNLYIA